MIDGPLAGLPKEYIPFVYFKQYLPVSNKVKVVFFYSKGTNKPHSGKFLQGAQLWKHRLVHNRNHDV